MQTWNVNVEKELRRLPAHGRLLRIVRRPAANSGQHQPARQRRPVRPYPALSASSPISPGATLGNITEVQSIGWSHYKGLWITANRRMSRGLQLARSYTLSKSTDTNSYDATGANNGSLRTATISPAAKGRPISTCGIVSASTATYELPFHGNRFRKGWQVDGRRCSCSPAVPFNVITNINTFTGVTSLRPDLVGDPAIIGSASQWFDNSVVRSASPVAGRARVLGVRAARVARAASSISATCRATRSSAPASPTWTCRVDQEHRVRGSARAQLRVEVFNLFNGATSVSPAARPSASTSFGVITNTRFPTGDSGRRARCSSRRSSCSDRDANRELGIGNRGMGTPVRRRH